MARKLKNPFNFFMPEPRPRMTLTNNPVASEYHKVTMDSQTGEFSEEDMDHEPINTQVQQGAYRLGFQNPRLPR